MKRSSPQALDDAPGEQIGVSATLGDAWGNVATDMSRRISSLTL